jgi:hypothetical protein
VGTVADQLVARASLPRPFGFDLEEIRPLWLAAAQERLRERAGQVPALQSRMAEIDVDAIRDFADLIPTLLTHDSYKSYPRDFLLKGRWAMLGKWLRSLSTRPLPDVDLSDVSTQDDWVRTLTDHGFPVYASSGTSGKSSFLPASPADREFTFSCLLRSLTWQHGITPDAPAAVLVLAPSRGDSRALEYYRRVADYYGDPARTYFLTDEPVRLHDLNAYAALAAAVAAGTATPEEITRFQAEQRERGTRLDADWDKLAGHAESLAGERVILQGFWPQQYELVQRLRARGHTHVQLDPGSVIAAGGGAKNARLPDDFAEQIRDFWGLSKAQESNGYGMSELSAALPEINGRYQLQPWIIPLVLNEDGTELATAGPDGRTEGRFAFLDLALEGRWGGLISGDRVIVDSGGPGFGIVACSVARYSDLRGGSDDRLTCAGTVDAFVRGLAEVEA